MSQIAKKPTTRNDVEHFFAGKPLELPVSDPPTFRLIIQYTYYLLLNNEDLKHAELVSSTVDKIFFVWQSISSALPLLSKKAVRVKVNRLVQQVRSINWKKSSTRAENTLTNKLDRLFDISSCTCNLDAVSCSHPQINCRDIDCRMEHILCRCPSNKQVPIEERLYLKDQRQKVGLKGSLQLGIVEGRLQEESLHDDTITPRESSLEESSTEEDSINEVRNCSLPPDGHFKQILLSSLHYWR